MGNHEDTPLLSMNMKGTCIVSMKFVTQKDLFEKDQFSVDTPEYCVLGY